MHICCVSGDHKVEEMISQIVLGDKDEGGSSSNWSSKQGHLRPCCVGAILAPLFLSQKQHGIEEVQDIITHLCKSVGLEAVLTAIRPLLVAGLDEERASATLGAVACAVGVPALLPLLIDLCWSQDSWQARLAGVKAIRHIATAVDRLQVLLPNLKSLVFIVKSLIEDDNTRVTRAAAMLIGALAEAAAPDGFDDVFKPLVKPLWKAIRHTRGIILAHFSAACCSIIPLMDHLWASYVSEELFYGLPSLLQSLNKEPKGEEEEEIRLIALRIIKFCLNIDHPYPYLNTDYHLGPLFFKSFWARTAPFDRTNYRLLLLEATTAFAKRLGTNAVNERIEDQLRHEGNEYMQMVRRLVEKALLATTDEDLFTDMDLLLSSRLSNVISTVPSD